MLARISRDEIIAAFFASPVAEAVGAVVADSAAYGQEPRFRIMERDVAMQTAGIIHIHSSLILLVFFWFRVLPMA